LGAIIDLDTAGSVLDAAALGLLGLGLIGVLVKRLEMAIAFLAVQGVVLGVASGVAAMAEMQWRAWAAFAVAALVKAVAIPVLLWFMLGRVTIHHDVETVVAVKLAFPLAVALAALAYWVMQPLSTAAAIGAHGFDAPNALPAALALLLLGLFTMATRKGALTQVIGLVTMENGIYLGGVVATGGLPIVVEIGIAMDVLTGAALLALVAHEINRLTSGTNIDRLRSLRG
jgi:hydrogenase-4 component E